MRLITATMTLSGALALGDVINSRAQKAMLAHKVFPVPPAPKASRERKAFRGRKAHRARRVIPARRLPQTSEW